MQFLGRREHLYGFLGAQLSPEVVLLAPYGADMCCLPCHFGQVVHQEAVRLVLLLHCFHDAQQVFFFVCQHKTECVYLRRMHIRRAVGLQGLQQAVGAQPEGMVTGAVGSFPPDDALAENGEFHNALVDGIDIVPHLLYLG